MSRAEADAMARLDRIPMWPFGNALLFILAASYFFSFVDLVNIGYALPVIAQQLKSTIEAVAVAISTGLIGYIVGALILAAVSDAFGRRLSLISAVLLFTLGSLVTTFAGTVGWIIIGRFIIGMGIGSMTAQGATYLSELSPAKFRGKFSAFAISWAFVGAAVTPFIALVLVPNFSWGWRGLFFVGALGGLLVLFGAKAIIESPRWLITHGRAAEAEALVAAAEQRARNKLGADLPPVVPLPAEHESAGLPLKDLFSRPFVGYVFLLFFMWFFVFMASYSYLGLAPTLFVKQGFNISTSIGFFAVAALGYLLGPAASSYLADRAERKWLALVGGLLSAFGLIMIGVVPTVAGIMVFAFIQTFGNNFFLIPGYPLTAEHFPTRIRSTGVALTDGLGHLGGAVAPFATLAVYAKFGFGPTFWFMGVIWLIGGLLAIFTRRTAHKALTVVEAEEVSGTAAV